MQRQLLPKMIVLQASNGEHLGFILLAVADDADRGECVFMILPPNTALFASPDVEPLFARKSLGESKVHVASFFPLHLTIASTGLPKLILEFSASGAGTWREEAPGTASGLAAITAAV
jgi:hypothetical protein